ncbi:HAMP domain-containing sensor histidine kinase [uncultured Prevotella sp.]|uniref:sensor histidine kinase n=1 Tax=uncultured Prevotella sp. TaxID=159272 RepID=UPI0026178B83|nr:HAMP domain-containing sensor histidine kinase [uncultured Prevotella sp.]
MDFEVVLLFVIAVVAAAGCLYFWRRYRSTVKKVAFLFNAIDNGDYNFRFAEGDKVTGDRVLNRSLNRVKGILTHARDEQMEREKYFELILDSVDTGIIVVEESRGVVLRYNRAAQKLLQREVITHVDQIKESMKSFSLRETNTVLKGRRVRIVAFSDIKGELANQEIDSWVKLIRVLTHEIMNTVTPIVSLSDTLLRQSEGEQREGLSVINRTGKELVKFVENYRRFTHVPTPQPTLFYVKPFLERMSRLAGQILKDGCTVVIDVQPKDILVYADEGLIGRVVSNLLKNAAEAVPTGGHIWLKAYTGEKDTVVIDVVDDGPMIPDDVASHIFVPFFTTKKDGSGIGLSISRQIMRVSNGFISQLTDKRERLTIFRLTFI